MEFLFLRKRKAAAWLAAPFCLLSSMAHAQQNCSSDSDCDAGFTCEFFASACDCAVSSDSAAGDEGEESASSSQLVECDDCGTTDQGSCAPNPDCESDADCAQGYVCYAQELQRCDARALPDCAEDDVDCQAEAEALAEEEPDCQSEEVSSCVPRWALPCEEAADCGPGFECVAGMTCWCTGSAAAPAMDADEAETSSFSIEEDPNCGCEPAEEHYCELLDSPCEADSDCDEGLICETSNFAAVTACTAPAPREDGALPEAECTEAETETYSQCMPPYYGGDASLAASSGLVAESAALGGDSSDADEDEDADTTEDEADVTTQSGTGTASTTAEPDDGEGEEVDSGVAADDEDAAGETIESPANDSDGCSAASGAPALSHALWLGLPLLALRRRKRVAKA